MSENYLAPPPCAPCPSQISVIQETKASGPYCSLVLSVTVIKDVVLFLLFAICTDLLSTVRGL